MFLYRIFPLTGSVITFIVAEKTVAGVVYILRWSSDGGQHGTHGIASILQQRYYLNRKSESERERERKREIKKTKERDREISRIRFVARAPVLCFCVADANGLRRVSV